MQMTGDEFINLYVKNGKILPNNVTEITDDLNLYNMKIKKIENLPNIINGDLSLSSNKIKQIENLPTIIKGEFYIINNPVYSEFEKSNFTKQKEWAYMIMKLDVWDKL